MLEYQAKFSCPNFTKWNWNGKKVKEWYNFNTILCIFYEIANI